MFGLGYFELDPLYNLHFGFSDRYCNCGFSESDVCLTPYPEFLEKSKRRRGGDHVGGRSR
jgi:hypothetical protein